MLSLETLARQVRRAARPTEGPWVSQQGSSPSPQLDSSTEDGRSRGTEGPDSKLHLKVNQPIDQAINQSIEPDLACSAFSLIISHSGTIRMTASIPSPRDPLSAVGADASLDHSARKSPTRATNLTLSYRKMQDSDQQVVDTASLLQVIGPPPRARTGTPRQRTSPGLSFSVVVDSPDSPAVLSSRRCSSL